MTRLNKDRCFALLAMAMALYLGITSFSYPAESAFFPRALSILLGGLGALFFIRLSLKGRAATAPSPAARESCEAAPISNEKLALKSAALVFGAIIGYGLLIILVNYQVATTVFVLVMVTVLGFKRRLIALAVALGLMFLLHGIFFELLGVPLPESLWLGE